MSRLHRIGLTGGIGSGKSTAASMFRELGVPVLDLDRVGHAVTMPGSEGLKALVQVFGERICHVDGSLNRRALADYCFANAERTAQLNSIIHPLIWQQEELWLARQQADYVLIEASVLLESGGASRMDQVVVVLADESLRLQRVLSRGRHDEVAFRAIVARQCDDAMRRRLASYIIDNNGDLAALRDQVGRVHTQLLLC
ncbi:dephospho-CoA kinase [Mariprofundus ferrooxydans]|uniref:dephospho-CoA kinase n=1 Tax=Mariprofundus ferrooxydans TaxID=314344 RepID=UPI00039F31B8|nr:dephospho-CoA kinase [Mariprofundus ferrooxydans]